MAFGETDDGSRRRLNKLGLGTVQFGMKYGISNTGGQTSANEVRNILEFAGKNGIDLLDTAADYGTSEEVLGSFPESQTFRIVTKTSRASPKEGLVRSLERLKRNSVSILLVHHGKDLLGERGPELWRTLERFRDDGKTGKIGCSVYSGEEIDAILGKFRIEAVQIPYNVFDQRLRKSGHLERLKEKGIEIHARSAFLQGLLLMEPESISPAFSRYRENFESYARTVADQGLSKLEAAIGFVVDTPEIDRVVCGVNDARQLQEIVDATRKSVDRRNFANLAIDAVELLDPSRWNAQMNGVNS